MLKFALAAGRPVAIRYPRGEAYAGLIDARAPIEEAKAEVLFDESEIVLFAVGSMVKTGREVREKLKEKGRRCTLVNARFVKPFDKEYLDTVHHKHDLIVTMEENVANGGFGERVMRYLDEAGSPIRRMCVALPDRFVAHGAPDELKAQLGIDADSIAARILSVHPG